jgi:hypothetical protein
MTDQEKDKNSKAAQDKALAQANEATILHRAYSFIRSREMNKAVASMTLDHLLQEHIERIEGGDSRAMLSATGRRGAMRPSKLAELKQLEDDIASIVRADPSMDIA